MLYHHPLTEQNSIIDNDRLSSANKGEESVANLHSALEIQMCQPSEVRVSTKERKKRAGHEVSCELLCSLFCSTGHVPNDSGETSGEQKRLGAVLGIDYRSVLQGATTDVFRPGIKLNAKPATPAILEKYK